MKIFFDTSSLAKRYIEEEGSGEVEALCRRAESIGISILAVTELVSALARLVREKRLTSKQYTSLKETVLEEVEDAMICDVTTEVVRTSILLLEKNLLRSSDALHVASAHEWGADLFVTSDDRQRRAAKRIGLKTEKV